MFNRVNLERRGVRPTHMTIIAFTKMCGFDPGTLPSLHHKIQKIHRPHKAGSVIKIVGVSRKGANYMFCPKCRSEFIDGIKKCPECMVGLIEELPPKSKKPKTPKPQFVEFEEIPVTLCSSDIMILKLVLDRENITYYIKGEYFQISIATPKLMVRTDQVEIAKKLMKGLKLSCMDTKLDKESKNE
jgi:hypothetical protein